VPGALSNPIRPVYAVWLGWLAPADASLAFVAEEASLERVIEESMLVGFEDFAGYLAGGMDPWTTSGLPVATTQLVDAQEAKQAIESGAIVIDVREPAEYASGHLPNARSVPLGELADRAGELPRDVPLVLHCGHGERALSAASLLEVSRTDQLLVLRGGTAAWREAGHAVERGED
jgi:hydroxyacylglutathione hydrolase